MKTEILFAVRCNPSITAKKAQAIQSNGTAYISELIRLQDGTKYNIGMKEVSSFEELKKAAEANPDKDILIKTASLRGAARFFISK